MRAAEAVGTALLEAEAEAEDASGDDLDADDGISDGPLVRLVNSLIFQAAEEGASDVHFEPQEDSLVVRFRIDGVLREVQRIPKRMSAGVTTRLKVLAKLDIAERRKPQDGRITLSTAAVGRMLDIRLATLPTVEGEKVVMRLLDKSRRAPTLLELGLSEAMRERLTRDRRLPTGALLVTGPTGSGKSTTLYACLAQINRPEINIITVEDPVEYRLAGVNQVQINVRAGLTFASSLRSILRSDPDVVMVGEIRDAETAKISIEAALTGHFVLSTLHTNDAPSTITRLGEMGVEPFLTGAAVSAVLAQRLARKLCTHCCEAYTPREAELLEARVSREVARASDGAVFYRKKGCPRCNHTGYRGRIGLYQLLHHVRGDRRRSPSATRAATRSRARRWRAACGRCGTTAWRRSPPASPPSKSSRASSPSRPSRARRARILTGHGRRHRRCTGDRWTVVEAATIVLQAHWVRRSRRSRPATPGSRYDACTSQPRAISASTACVTKRVASTGLRKEYGPGRTGSSEATLGGHTSASTTQVSPRSIARRSATERPSTRAWRT